MSKINSNNDVEKTTVKKTDKAIPKEFKGWYDFRKQLETKRDEWVSFKNRNVVVLKIIDWTIRIFDYEDRNWPSKEYIMTTKGRLSMGKRLKKALLPFAEANYKETLRIEKIGEGLNTDYVVEEYKPF